MTDVMKWGRDRWRRWQACRRFHKRVLGNGSVPRFLEHRVDVIGTTLSFAATVLVRVRREVDCPFCGRRLVKCFATSAPEIPRSDDWRRWPLHPETRQQFPACEGTVNSPSLYELASPKRTKMEVACRDAFIVKEITGIDCGEGRELLSHTLSAFRALPNEDKPC